MKHCTSELCLHALSFFDPPPLGNLKLRARAPGMRRTRAALQLADPSAIADPFAISFLTDTEGNLSYLKRWAALSRVVSARPEGAGVRLAFRRPDLPQHHLVFGGDVCDHGPGDLRILDALLDFRRRHPRRVHLSLIHISEPTRPY